MTSSKSGKQHGSKGMKRSKGSVGGGAQVVKPAGRTSSERGSNMAARALTDEQGNLKMEKRLSSLLP
eukprot:scaffold215814_cov26-Tisochrysis_lutea.AAC.1